MIFKTHVAVAAHPDLDLRIRTAPLSFEIGGDASFMLATGEIDARFDEIPIAVTIPFLRRRHGRVIAGSIGPFGVHLKPIEAEIRAVGVRVNGVVGKDGTEMDLHGTGACKADIEVSGQLPGRLLKAAVEGIVED
jgi:hypothetical protein